MRKRINPRLRRGLRQRSINRRRDRRQHPGLRRVRRRLRNVQREVRGPRREVRGPRREQRVRVRLPEEEQRPQLEAGPLPALEGSRLRPLEDGLRPLPAVERRPGLAERLLRPREARPRLPEAERPPLLAERLARRREERRAQLLAARPLQLAGRPLRQAVEAEPQEGRPAVERRLQRRRGIGSRRTPPVRGRPLKRRAATGRILIAADMWPPFTPRVE